ncbi:MAG: GIY-YIG nuclease family protein [Ruminococcus sp.]|nr:GIY-YIG nuclease family protein [Ruminococcus sp.]
MFGVYKITNLINNKSYIGSSNNIEYRWQQHIQNSTNENKQSYKYPLQCAFRKYGIDNFSFEILKNNFNTRYEAEEYEQQMIDYYDSYNNGYNQTRETHNALTDESIRQASIEKRSQPCAKVDFHQNIIEIYHSYQEAARLNNVENAASHIRLVCKGEESSWNGFLFRDLDENGSVILKPLKSYKGKKKIIGIDINNPTHKEYFDSISEAAQILHTERKSIQQCIAGSSRYSIVKNFIFRELDEQGEIIENNILIQDKIEEYNTTNPCINGERHNIKEWCQIYNISTTSYYKRRKKGMGVIEALTTPTRR